MMNAYPWMSRTSFVDYRPGANRMLPPQGFPATMIGCACHHALSGAADVNFGSIADWWRSIGSRGARAGEAPEAQGPQELIQWPYDRYYYGYGPRQYGNDARAIGMSRMWNYHPPMTLAGLGRAL